MLPRRSGRQPWAAAPNFAFRIETFWGVVFKVESHGTGLFFELFRLFTGVKRNAGKGLPFLFFISANSPPPLNFDLMLAIAAKAPYLFVETGFSKCSLKSFSLQENLCDPLLELVLQDL